MNLSNWSCARENERRCPRGLLVHVYKTTRRCWLIGNPASTWITQHNCQPKRVEACSLCFGGLFNYQNNKGYRITESAGVRINTAAESDPDFLIQTRSGRLIRNTYKSYSISRHLSVRAGRQQQRDPWRNRSSWWSAGLWRRNVPKMGHTTGDFFQWILASFMAQFQLFRWPPFQ